jgi:hypothetical protein
MLTKKNYKSWDIRPVLLNLLGLLSSDLGSNMQHVLPPPQNFQISSFSQIIAHNFVFWVNDLNELNDKFWTGWINLT